VVADLRAEPSADRVRKARAVDLSTKQFWQYQTSLRSNKFRVIAGTLNGLDFSVRAIDSQPGACSVGLPSYGTFFRGAFRTLRGLSQRCSWVLASKRSGSCPRSAQGVVTLLPELPKRSPCAVSFSRSALLSDDQQYGTSPRGSAFGARLTNRRIESRRSIGTRTGPGERAVARKGHTWHPRVVSLGADHLRADRSCSPLRHDVDDLRALRESGCAPPDEVRSQVQCLFCPAHPRRYAL
jgi:hypothetical protein